jgi:hypothetical protein
MLRLPDPKALSEWMEEHARVCWFPASQPWLIESEAITQLDLPLNLDQNRSHPFHQQLTKLRAEAKARARERPILRSSPDRYEHRAPPEPGVAEPDVVGAS